MKKFRFTLEKLHRYKENILSKEKGTLAALRTQQNKVGYQLDFLQSEKEKLAERIRKGAQKGTTARELQTIQFQIENIGYQLLSLRDELSKLDKLVAVQLHTVVELTKEKSELEKLHEKQLEAFNKEEANENALILSEFVSSSVIRKRHA